MKSRWFPSLLSSRMRQAQAVASTSALVVIGLLTAPLANSLPPTPNTQGGKRSQTRTTTTQHLMDQLKDHPDLTSFPDTDGLAEKYEQIQAKNSNLAVLTASFFNQLVNLGVPSEVAGNLTETRFEEMLEEEELETFQLVSVDDDWDED